MKRTTALLFSTLMVLSAIAGCLGGDTDELESKIDKLEQENSDLQDLVDSQNETIQSQNNMITTHISNYENLNQQLNSSLSNITDLENELIQSQAYRDSLIVLLEDSNETNSDLEDDLMMAELYSTYVQSLLDQEIANSMEINDKINETNSEILRLLNWPAQDHIDHKYLNDFLMKLISIDWNANQMGDRQYQHACMQSTGYFIGEPILSTGGYSYTTITYNSECAEYLMELYGEIYAEYGITLSEGDVGAWPTDGGENFGTFNMDYFILNDANLENVVISLSSVSFANFSNADLSGASIISDYITSSNFNGADLSGATVVGDLTGSDFTDAVINGATIASYGQDCPNVVENGWLCISGHVIGPDSGYAENWDFSYSNFSGMNLTGAEIINANFSNADLTNIVMLEGKLTGDLSGADLTGAWIAGANLSGLTGTNVTCPNGGLAEYFADCKEGGLIGPFTELYDDDLDGYNEMEGDCDDNDPTAYPNATEVHDYRDNDCDGDVDDDIDYDGYTIWDGDCDDNDSSINPGVTELYDGIDNNCDGQVDEGFSIYYRDADGDTYGDPAVTVYATSQPSGYTSYAGDCDDSDMSVNPSATEDPTNGIDDDCDGSVDEP